MTTTRRACLLGVLLVSFAGCDGGGGGASEENEVSGRILEAPEIPAANALVQVGSTSTRTGPDGRFAVTGVTTPYDLHVGGVGNAVTSYLGLTLRALPDIQQAGGSAGSAPAPITATLTGTLTGGSISASNRVVYVVFCADGRCDSAGTTTASYSLPVTISARTVTGKLLALEATHDTGGAPTSWGQSVVASATVTADQINSQDLVLTTPLASRTITGTITAPAGMDPVALAYVLSDGTSGWLVHDVTVNAGSALGIVLPVVPGFTPHYSAEGLSMTLEMSRTAGPIPEGELVVDLIAPVTLTAPSAATTGVTSVTDFTWTPHAGAVHGWRATCPGAARYVRTAGATARFVALDGYPVPAGQTCSWVVFTYEPFTSMDAFVEPGPGTSMSAAPTFTQSARRSFQLQ